MSLPNDERTLQRFLDGQLDPAAAAAFRSALASDAALRERVETERRLRAGFAAARGTTAPAGFTAGVMAAVRRLPGRDVLEQQDVGDRIVRLCRRLLIAAAVLFGIGLVWHSGLFDVSTSRLEAAPDEIQREMERLDALIRAGQVGERR